MGAPEFLHSAPDIAKPLGEARHLLAEPHQLLDTLRSLGHPYGLLLNQTTLSKESVKFLLLPSDASSQTKTGFENLPSCTQSSLQSYLVSLLGASASLSEVGSTGSSEFFSVFSDLPLDVSDAFLGNTFPSLHDENTQRRLRIPLGITQFLSSWILSASLAKKYNPELQQQSVLPTALLVSNKELPERLKGLQISYPQLSFGSASICLSLYRGQEPFAIKTPDGEPVAEIQPGAPLAALHVSHQAARFRNLSPLEKASAITKDTLALLSAIDQTDPQTLEPKQRETLARAQNATIIGISHLVRLFRRQTGLPTWKLDVLPEVLQRFHAFDSQVVSNQFGGKRKVKPQDVEMLVITPSQRRQLVVSF